MYTLIPSGIENPYNSIIIGEIRIYELDLSLHKDINNYITETIYLMLNNL